MDAWQLDGERAAAPGFALNADPAAVRLDDATHEVQAEAAALNLASDRLTPAIERLEDVLPIFGGDPDAAIFD